MIGFLFAAALSAAPFPERDTTWTENIEEIVVTSLRQDEKLVETPADMAVVKAADITRQSAVTLADVLKFEPGICMGGDGIWATNVNVRGMSENRLVTLVDGNRIETAADLTASMSMFDVNDVERVEIVKGAQSSLYGSGAMGGIVNVITRDGHFADRPYFEGSARIGYASANNYFNPYLSVLTGSRKWYLRASGSFGEAKDIRTPKGILDNSGFKSWNAGMKFALEPASDHLLKIQFQHNHSYDVGIPGGAAIAPTATADYRDINRTLVDANYEIKNLSRSFKSLKFRVFYQSILRDVLMLPNVSTKDVLPDGSTRITTPSLITPYGSHRTFGAQAQGIWHLGEHSSLIGGVDAWRRNIGSHSVKHINVSVQGPDGTTLASNVMERGETPLPDASFTSAGIFVQNESRLFRDRLKITIGGRIDGIFVSNGECHDVDYILLNGKEQPLPSQRLTFVEGNTAELSWSANLGILYKVGEKTDLVLNAARSFRAASLEERFKFIDLTSKVQLGNPALKPESGLCADLGARYWGDRFTFQGTLFVNRLTDMILETNGEFQGLPALVYDNVGRAFLYGFDLRAGYCFNYWFSAYASGSGVVGIDTDKSQWLPNIPPTSGRLGVIFTYPKAGALNLSAVFVGARTEETIAYGEKPVDGYCRIDLSLSSKIFDIGPATLQLLGGIDNLTDAAYTNFLSTNRSNIRFEPGRNAYLKICLAF